jgi:hypothetical protein
MMHKLDRYLDDADEQLQVFLRLKFEHTESLLSAQRKDLTKLEEVRYFGGIQIQLTDKYLFQLSHLRPNSSKRRMSSTRNAVIFKTCTVTLSRKWK